MNSRGVPPVSDDHPPRWIGVLMIAGALAFIGFSAWRTVHPWRQAQAWVETPARITSARLQEKQVDRHQIVRVDARYEYRFGEQDYVGYKVLLGSTDATLDRRDAHTHTELEELIAAGGRTVCYVNPAAPNEAVLDRSLRYEDLLVLVTAGAIVLGGGVTLLFKSGQRALGTGRRGGPGEWLGLAVMMLGFNALPWLINAFSARPAIWLYVSAAGVGLITLLMAREGLRSAR